MNVLGGEPEIGDEAAGDVEGLLVCLEGGRGRGSFGEAGAGDSAIGFNAVNIFGDAVTFVVSATVGRPGVMGMALVAEVAGTGGIGLAEGLAGIGLVGRLGSVLLFLLERRLEFLLLFTVVVLEGWRGETVEVAGGACWRGETGGDAVAFLCCS